MKLRRINPKTKQTFSDTLISRTAAGTCLDFNVADPMFYLVGTEDGLIHKCSRSYPDYIETYYAHLGGIQRVRWNPFDSDYFLSAGADRTVRLWHHDHAAQPVISFTSFHDTPKDIAWSPVCGTVFAVGLGDGSLQVWDIASSVVDPVAVTQPEVDRQVHAIHFHPDGTLLYSGDVLGCVNIYKLANVGVKKLPKPQQGEYLRTILKREVGDVYDSTPLSYTPITSLIALTRTVEEDVENEGIEETKNVLGEGDEGEAAVGTEG
jgi:WD40 repeat protein